MFAHVLLGWDTFDFSHLHVIYILKMNSESEIETQCDKMENSANETHTFRSPPRRRKSTFFERRDSIVPQNRPDDESNFEQDNRIDKTNTESTENLKRYYDQLLLEKEQWKLEFLNRRNKYYDLRQQYKIELKSSTKSRMSYSALSNEDIEFLKGKPNISKLIDDQQKLHQSVNATWAIYKRLNELEDAIVNYSEDIVNKVTEYILENSTIEPLDTIIHS